MKTINQFPVIFALFLLFLYFNFFPIKRKNVKLREMIWRMHQLHSIYYHKLTLKFKFRSNFQSCKHMQKTKKKKHHHCKTNTFVSSKKNGHLSYYVVDNKCTKDENQSSEIRTNFL